jgi:hypothetical protein
MHDVLKRQARLLAARRAVADSVTSRPDDASIELLLSDWLMRMNLSLW